MSVDDEMLSIAEQKAAALETSVSDVLVEYLRQWTSESAVEHAREEMRQRFQQPNWRFSVGVKDDREQRNARP